MNVVYTILAFLIGFTIMVLVHEWGHYITGRLFHVKIDEFAVGMGPKIFSRKGKKNNVLFSIRAFPIGGFVKFAGDGESYGEQTVIAEDDPDILPNKKVWQRFIIAAAGAVMNVVLGFVLLLIIYMVIGIPSNTPTIGKVIEGQPAQIAGMQAGDILLKIDGVDIIQDNYNEASKQVGELLTDKKSIVTVKRDGEIIDLEITPVYSDEEGNKGYKIGVYFGYVYEVKPLTTALSYSAKQAGEMITLIVRAFRDMIFKGEGLDNVGGPVSIVQVISDATKDSFISVLSIFAALSLNLAVVNMIPFPALDGGMCLLLIIEAIRRKPLSKNVSGWISVIGFAVLMILMILLTVKDVISL